MKIVTLVLIALVSCSYAGTEKECPFCDPKLLDKQAFLIEDQAIGLCTYKPVVPGHVLIIPARHVERFDELTDQEIAAMKGIIVRIHKASRVLFGNEDYLLMQKNGPSAGQTVSHVHFHYYPRSEELGNIRFATRLLARAKWAPVSEEETKKMVSLWVEQLRKQHN